MPWPSERPKISRAGNKNSQPLRPISQALLDSRSLFAATRAQVIDSLLSCNTFLGKTALMAQAALMCSEIREYFMIVRFVGTSMRSSTVSELLRNLCLHLGRIYGQSNANLPSSYSTLKVYHYLCAYYLLLDYVQDANDLPYHVLSFGHLLGQLGPIDR